MCDWFIPMMPPTKLLTLAMMRSRLVRVDAIIYRSTASGANFCQVDKYRDVIHGRAVIADGYQK
jgi:hypothetical protein